MVAIIVAAPVVGAVISLLGRHWYAGGDQALELLRISDVGGSHTPLLGAWSRWGWAHPGPLLFWLLAPFYRVFGQTGVLTGMAVVNLVCMIAAVLLAYRRSGARLAVLVGLMVALLAHGSHARVVDPWNPWAAFFPFILFLLLVWSVLCDDVVMLPVAVAIGSFLVQTHAGYLPLVAGLLVLAAVSLGFPGTGDTKVFRRYQENGRWLAIAAAVGVVVWLPAIAEQLSGGDNVRNMLSYLRHPSEPAVGWDLAFTAMGGQLRPNGAWITGHDSSAIGFLSPSSAWPGTLTLAAVALAGAFAWRRGHHDAARLALVGLVATGLALVASARITGPPVPYVLQWWRGVAALATLSIVWSVVTDLRTPRARGAVSAVALIGLAATAAVMLRDLPVALPEEQVSRTIEAIGAPTAAALRNDERYLVRAVDPTLWGAAWTGLYFDLERRGFDVFVDRSDVSSLQYGEWREATPIEVDAMVMIVALPDLEFGTWRPLPASRLVASYDPLTAAQRARVRELTASIRTALGANAPPDRFSVGIAEVLAFEKLGASRTELDELRALTMLGDGYAVYLTPPEAP